jgi:hypothetical protein
MRSNQVDGLAETYSMLGRLPEAAREQVGVEMALIGYEVLRAQKRDVDKHTGALAAGLSLQLELDELRVRVGLIGMKARSKSALRAARKSGRAPGESFGDLYYGRFVEFGRKAQTVLVERRRRVGGLLRTQSRGSRKRAEDIAATYSMKVKARAPRPFVHVDRPEIRAEQRLAGFWAEVLANSGRMS